LGEPQHTVKVASHDVVVHADEFADRSVVAPLKLANLPASACVIAIDVRNRSIENFLHALFVCRSNLFERRRNAGAAFDDAVTGNQPPCVFCPCVGKLCDIDAKHCIAVAANKIMNVSVDTHGVTSCQ